MKKLLLLFIGLILINFSFGQTSITAKTFDNDSNLAVFRYYQTDTLLIMVDTVYVFNKATFTLYNRAYNAYRTNKTCSELYDPLILNLNNQITFQKTEYKKLQSVFDDTKTIHNKYTVDTKATIINLNQTNDSLMVNNDKLKQNIKDLNRKHKWQLIKVGGITLGVGILITGTSMFLLQNR